MEKDKKFISNFQIFLKLIWTITIPIYGFLLGVNSKTEYVGIILFIGLTISTLLYLNEFVNIIHSEKFESFILKYKTYIKLVYLIGGFITFTHYILKDITFGMNFMQGAFVVGIDLFTAIIWPVYFSFCFFVIRYYAHQF